MTQCKRLENERKRTCSMMRNLAPRIDWLGIVDVSVLLICRRSMHKQKANKIQTTIIRTTISILSYTHTCDGIWCCLSVFVSG